MTIHWIPDVRAKNLKATLLFVDFSKAFDSIHRVKMEQILRANGLPKETVAAIMMLYKNTKVKVRSLDEDTDYFDIVGVLQGIPVYYLPRLRASNVYRFNKRKQLHAGKKKKQEIPRTNYYGRRLRRWHSASGKYTHPSRIPLHSPEGAAAGIGLYVNADKLECMCFNQRGDISTDGPLKLVDKFTYLESSVSSTENDINARLAKAWTSSDRLSVILKSDLSDKLKRSFFQAAVISILLYGCTTWTLTKRMEKNLDGNYTRILRAVLNPRGNTLQNYSSAATDYPSPKPSELDDQDMQDIAGEVREKWL